MKQENNQSKTELQKSIIESKEFIDALNSLPDNERENVKKNFEDLIELFESKFINQIKSIIKR